MELGLKPTLFQSPIVFYLCARASAMSPAIATPPSALQSATFAPDPAGTGDPCGTAIHSWSARRVQPAIPWAKAVSVCLVMTSTLACALVGSGSAKLPPTQQPLIKNLTGIKPGASLPGQFRVGRGAAGYDLQHPKETPLTEVVPLKSPDVILTSATPRPFRDAMFQKIFTPMSKDDVSYLAGAGLAAAILAVTLHTMAGAVPQALRDFNY